MKFRPSRMFSVTCLILGVLIGGARAVCAQTPLTPAQTDSTAAKPSFVQAQPTTITDPSRVWLKVDNPTVIMKVRVNKEGKVDKVLENSVTDALKLIYEYAAKKEWRFKPATVNGKPVSSEVVVELRYVVQSTQTVLSCAPSK